MLLADKVETTRLETRAKAVISIAITIPAFIVSNLPLSMT